MIKVCSANFLQTCCHFRAVKRFMMGKPSAGIIIIGDEILKGQTQDTNTHFLAKNLQAQGIKLKRVVVIPDDIAIIASEIKSFSESYDYVLTSGGVGPTHDDVTYEGVAKAFDDKTFLHPEMEELIRKFFKDVNPAVLKLGQVCQYELSSKIFFKLDLFWCIQKSENVFFNLSFLVYKSPRINFAVCPKVQIIFAVVV
jgi:molybdenum cofactor synthesis domain-containing protein